MEKPPLTTHVLNLATGKPAAGMGVELYKTSDTASVTDIAGTTVVARGTTDADGRVAVWNAAFSLLIVGDYQIDFATGPWFEARGEKTLYPKVSIVFRVEDLAHYHIPLLLGPYGYSTYRGS